MIHAALVVAAVAGVGTAVAFEIGVFRPWREVNWPNGFAEGIKQEWKEFSENVKQEIRETSGDFRRQREHWQRPRDVHQFRGTGSGGNSSELEEEMQLRREMDEFTQHEAQVSVMKSRLATEFDEEREGPPRRRNLQGQSWNDSGEDMRAIDLPLIQQQGRSFSAAADDENPFADSSSHPSKRTPPSNTLDMSSNASSESDAQQHQQRLYNPAESMSGPAISRAASNQSHETSPNHNNLTQSPLSPQSTTIQDDWQSQLSPSSHAASHPDESDGEAWIQLTDSRSTTPLSPLSPSWDTNELARDLR